MYMCIDVFVLMCFIASLYQEQPVFMQSRNIVSNLKTVTS